MNQTNLIGLEIGWRLAKLRRKSENERACPICGKPFRIDGSRLMRVKGLICCSVKCKAESQKGKPTLKKKTGIKQTCSTCGKTFQKPPSHGVSGYCCQKCRTADRKAFDKTRGPKHYRWQSEKRRTRADESSSWWRNQVFIRDGYTCFICGYAGKGLNAHHLKHWAEFPELRHEVRNGITLCRPCHTFLHWNGWRIIRRVKIELMKTDNGHYYTKTGEPMHFVPKKDGSGNRPTTVSDVKKLGLIPSPTQVLKLLNKPALIDWLIRTAVAAVVTAPDVDGEGLDAKITRVLETEKQQDQESRLAMDLGTRIHEAIELTLNGIEPPEWTEAMSQHVFPVIDAVNKLGRVVATEKIVVGKGCAGKLDCLTENDDWIHVVDFKTARKLPDKGAWPEHAMQVGFYASALGSTGDKRIGCTIIYISTSEPGKIAMFSNEDWQRDYQKFELVLKYWYLHNNVPMPEGMV